MQAEFSSRLLPPGSFCEGKMFRRGLTDFDAVFWVFFLVSALCCVVTFSPAPVPRPLNLLSLFLLVSSFAAPSSLWLLNGETLDSDERHICLRDEKIGDKEEEEEEGEG